MLQSSIEPSESLTPEQRREILVQFLAEAEPEERQYRLSYAQKRIWFLEQLEPGTGVHNLASGLRLSGDLHVAALERALTRVVEHQTVLRSVFITVDNEPWQRVLAAREQRIPILDLTDVPDESSEDKAYRIAWLEARAPFDLLEGPPIRVRLLKLRETDHILLFTMHHIVSDGISMGLFADELAAFYEQELSETPSEAPEIPIEYGEYAEWQLTAVESDELQLQIDFWRKRLAGAPQLLELPGDRPRPREQSLTGASSAGPLSADLMNRVRQACQREGVTAFCFLLATFVALLHRYSGAEDICVAVPVAGRNQVEIEKLIGLFVSLLVVRIDLSGNPRFCDVLSRVQRALLDAHANQDVPFEVLVEKLQPQRSMAYHPLVQMMVTSFQTLLKTRRFGPVSAMPYTVGSGASQFDLSSLFIESTGDRYWWQTDYSTALFDNSRIERMRGHFEQMARAAAASPERHIGGFALLTPAEEGQLARWNDTRKSFPAACVHDLVQEQARKTPQRAAVEFNGRILLYADLDSRADHLASKLAAAGARPGKLVAICLERSAEMVIGLLAILKTGAAYVPMDPAYPLERLSFMMRDAGIRTLLTRRGLRPELELLAEQPVYVGEDEHEPPLSRSSTGRQDPESLAYVIYTSGSTGKPKGVCIPHRAVVNLLYSMRREPGLNSDDRLLAVTTISFDIAGLEIFLPLITGATLVIAGAETSADGVKLLETIRQQAITAMQATPATWRLFIEAGWTRERDGLKVLCGGEALPPELAAQLVDRSDFVWNLYGPTETTIWSAVCRIERNKPVMIGKPIQNTQFHVLDARMQPVPVGVPGELFIGGAGVAKGYWNRVELMNERFVPDVFSARQNATMYRTGDEVRLREDGELEYLRRLDSQVKVRGFRIELGEIESALAKQDVVQQAVVTVREDVPGDKRLVGYVVLRAAAQCRPTELQTALRATLPEYMVPFIVVVEAFPLTPNGKVDRKRLPAPGSLASGGDERVFPRDEIERKLAEIWEDVLGVRPIAIRDSFFDVGGHSLMAIRVFARIRDTFGVSLPLSTLFHEPTIEHLAAELRGEDLAGLSNLIPLRAEGALPPFFIGGSNPRYLEITRLLGSEQPVYKLDLYALTERRLTKGLDPYPRFEDYAADFVKDIRVVQPHGPYYLGGGCDGGILALEVARQLEAVGETVGLLVIWETPRTGFFERDWFGSVLNVTMKAIEAPFRGDVSRLAGRLTSLLGHPEIPAASPEEARHFYVYDAFWAAIRHYSNPQPFRGKIVFIRARQQYRMYKNVAFGWEKMATGGIEIHSVPGDHDSYAKEYLVDFALVLKKILGRAQEAASGAGSAFAVASR